MTDKPDQDLKPETLDAKDDARTVDERQDQEEQQHLAAVEQAEKTAAPTPAATVPVEEPPAVVEQSRPTDVVSKHDHDFWAEYDDYRRRFDAIQAEFIEDPRAAVQKADSLMAEVVEHMIDALRNRMQGIHGDVSADGEVDTERLRLVMRSYRQLIDSMGGHQAA